jgi:hypothetical protein
MRKFIVLLLAVVLAVSALPMAVSATPINELNALASYFPEDTPIFFSFRTDDAFLDELDGLYSTLSSKLPGVVPPFDLNSTLDLGVSQIVPGGTFADNIRPWLGDTAAFAVLSLEKQTDADTTNDEEGEFVLALAITDRAAAEDFLVNTFNQQNVEFEQESGDGFTLFTPQNEVDVFANESAVIIRDDVALIGTLAEINLVNEGVSAALADSADFAATLDLLPEDDYNLIGYFNLADALSDAIVNSPDAVMMDMGFFTSLTQAVGTQAVGGTILDGRSLVLDTVQRLGDVALLESSGLQIADLGAVDPAFAVHIPGNAPFVAHGTNLKTLVETTLNNLRQTIVKAAEASPEDDSSELEEMDEGINEFNRVFTEATGLDFEQDVIGWMTGDFAAFLRLSPQLADGRLTTAKLTQTFPVDFGIAIENTDGAAAQRTVEGLTQGLQYAIEQADPSETTNVEVSQETIGGADVTVITLLPSDTSGMPYSLDILMGANEEVFAMGTRAAVTAILDPSNSLADEPAFAEAAAYLLADASSVFFLNPSPLLPLADLAGEFASPDEAEAQQNIARAGINLFSSATISQSTDDNGNTIGRFVLTLSQ